MKKIIIILFLIITPTLSFSDSSIAMVLYKEGLKNYIFNDYKAAIKNFKKCYSIDKNSLKIKEMYVRSLVKQADKDYEKGFLSDAKKHYSQAITISGKDVSQSLKDKLTLVEKSINAKTRPNPLNIFTNKTAANSIVKLSTNPTPINTTQKKIKKNIVIHQMQKNMQDKLKDPSQSISIAVLEKFIKIQNKQNEQLLLQMIKSQKDERELRHNDLKFLSASHSNDLKFFSGYLLLIIGIGVAIILSILLLIYRAMRKQRFYPSRNQIELNPRMYIEEAQYADDPKLLMNENYSGLIQTNKLKKLENSSKEKELSWEKIQGNISELSDNLKEDILSVVEEKISQGSNYSSEDIFEVLMPFITDGNENIANKSKDFLNKISNKNSTSKDIAVKDKSDFLNNTSLIQFATMVDIKTGCFNHSINVADISYKIALELNAPDLQPEMVKKAGLIHDIGYLEISKEIFKSPDKLTESQFEIIRSHTTEGVKLIDYANAPKIITDAILYHHERLDGSGYPEGISEKKIPEIAKIIAVADFFDALMSPRTYRKAFAIEKCFQMLEELKGKEFDSKIIDVLIKIYN